MAHAGDVAPPTITPLIHSQPAIPSSNIFTSTYIELATESPDCKLFFTTNGAKPTPFQRKLGGKETTFKYRGPFTLKEGKRILKAIAVSRDGLQESAVVTRTFNVREPRDGTTTDDYDYTSYSSFFETSDTDTTFKSSSTAKSKKKKTKGARLPAAREAWASDGRLSRAEPGAQDGAAAPAIPDGPFNPVNYSGTQINVWGGPPPGAWPGGMVAGGPPNPPYPVQYGFLTEEMIQGCNQNNRPVTVGDLRKLMGEQQKPPSPSPPKPAIEYRPTYQDPPLNAVSPGNGEDF